MATKSDRINRLIKSLELLAGNTHIEGLAVQGGAILPLVRCGVCASVLDIGFKSGLSVYDCGVCGKRVTVQGT